MTHTPQYFCLRYDKQLTLKEVKHHGCRHHGRAAIQCPQLCVQDPRKLTNSPLPKPTKTQSNQRRMK